MPVQIGPAPLSADIVDILLACHERIRRFSEAAVRLCAPGLSATEIREVAGQIRYYFRAAFRSHVEDEEDSLAPRLHALGGAVDAAVTAMEREHDSHAPQLARLAALCDALVDDPGRHGELAPELSAVALRLRDDFTRHLDAEETVIFPAIRERLTPADQAAVLREARARRGDA